MPSRRLQLDAHQRRLRLEPYPERRLHPVAQRARDLEQLGRRCPIAIDERERVLGGDAGATIAVATREAGALDQPSGRDLHVLVAGRPGRRVNVLAEAFADALVERHEAVAAEDRVQEERAGATAVRI